MSESLRALPPQLHARPGHTVAPPGTFIVVGGGCIGLATRPRRLGTRLPDPSWWNAAIFTSGTSSRSTKLIHGGVRYLRQGQIWLSSTVRWNERRRLRANAPHLVRSPAAVGAGVSLVASAPWYGLGLKLYDALALGRNLGSSRLVSRRESLKQLSTLRSHDLRGGVLFYDGAIRRRPPGMGLHPLEPPPPWGAIALELRGSSGVGRSSGEE